MSRTADPTIKIALLRAAESVFAEKGLVAAKVEEITRRAGTSKGAFYLHFESKEEAFKHVVEAFLARCSSMLPGPSSIALPETLTGWLETWLEIDEQMYEFLWGNRAIVAILMGCQGDHVYLLDAFKQEIHARTVGWVAHWKAHGVFRKDLDEELAATLVGGAHNELCRKMIECQVKPPISDWLQNVQSIFGRGFGTPSLVKAIDDAGNPPVSQPVLQRGEVVAARRRRKTVSR
jgi:AcrR family transcriptional regulator